MFVNTPLRYKSASASTLTSAYADNTKTVHCEGNSQLMIYVEYVPGENSAVLEIKIETGIEEDDLHEKIAQNTGSANITIYQTPYKFTGTTAGTTYKFVVPVNLSDIYARVSFKETASVYGTINFGLLGSGEL